MAAAVEQSLREIIVAIAVPGVATTGQDARSDRSDESPGSRRYRDGLSLIDDQQCR
jgi:hypothetical protein